MSCLLCSLFYYIKISYSFSIKKKDFICSLFCVIHCFNIYLCSGSLMHKIQENTLSVTDKFYHIILCHMLCAFYIGRYKSKLHYLTWSGFEPKIHHTRGSILTISLVKWLQPLCIFTFYSSCLQFLTVLHTIWGTGATSG